MAGNNKRRSERRTVTWSVHARGGGASLVYLILAPDAPDAARVRLSIGRALEETLLR